jgi:hypothetical protein
MLFVYLGLYTLILVIVWGFFLVTRIHSYKFKNFSNNIEKITNLLFFFLLTLSIIGYIMVFYVSNGTSGAKINNYSDAPYNFSEIDY